MAEVTALLRVLTIAWAALLLWRLREWRLWFSLGLFLLVTTVVMLSISPESVFWLFSPPQEAQPTALVIAITRFLIVVTAERALRAWSRARKSLEQNQAELEERVATRTRELARVNQALEQRVEDQRAAEQDLRSAAEHLRLVTDAVPALIAYIDTDQRYRFVNKRHQEWFGLSRTELLGLPVREVVGEKAYRKIKGRIENALAGKETTFEDQLTFQHGETRFVSAHYVPHFDSGGALKGFFALISDSTERQREEEERRKLEVEVQDAQRLESLGVLAGGIAHDFNNILVAIMTNVELALMDLPDDSPAREPIDQAAKASQRAAELTKQILAYAGKGRSILQSINLSDSVREMLDLLKLSVSKRVTLRFELSDDLPPIEGDVTQIRQVAMNLITNASEAIGDAPGTVTVRTGVRQVDKAYLAATQSQRDIVEGSYVYLKVSDTGCGMDPAIQKKIFEPFFTTKFTGRGLGLAAVLGIIKGHRGTLRIETEPQRGTTFTVLFPRATQSEQPPDPVPEQSRPWRGSGCILVIDDEQTVLSVTKNALERFGFRVLTASSGLQGIALFKGAKEKIVLVLLDLTMPGMDGQATFQKLRNLQADLKVVLMSGYGEDELLDRFVGTGVAAFIQKPYRTGELIEKVREVLTPEGGKVATSSV